MNALDRVQVAKTVRAFLDTKRPVDPAIRVKLDFAFRFHWQSVELLEIRPKFNKPGKTRSNGYGTFQLYWTGYGGK